MAQWHEFKNKPEEEFQSKAHDVWWNIASKQKTI